uniref:Hydrolase_4 domain-containing protein n=1 Tax=Rhabditophanes sp. KR3021 TaxID=114890 RepID=A0AC35UDI6_9BILA
MVLRKLPEVLQVLKKQENVHNIVHKSTPENAEQGNFFFGYNHPCFKFDDNIQFFFLKTNGDPSIACALAKSRVQTGFTIIYSHPITMDLSDAIIGFPNLMDISRFMDTNVVTYDYNGFGISSGNTTQENMVDGLNVLIRHLVKVRGIPMGKIVLLGYGVGASVCSTLAKTVDNIGGLVLVAAPANLKRSKREGNHSDSNQSFSIVKVIKQVTCPIFLVYSHADMCVNPVHGLNTPDNCQNVIEP